MVKFNPIAYLNLLPLIGLALQAYGTFKGGQASGAASATASRSGALQDEVTRRFLANQELLDKFRWPLGEKIAARVGKPSPYTRAWGGQGSFYRGRK